MPSRSSRIVILTPALRNAVRAAAARESRRSAPSFQRLVVGLKGLGSTLLGGSRDRQVRRRAAEIPLLMDMAAAQISSSSHSDSALTTRPPTRAGLPIPVGGVLELPPHEARSIQLGGRLAALVHVDGILSRRQHRTEPSCGWCGYVLQKPARPRQSSCPPPRRPGGANLAGQLTRYTWPGACARPRDLPGL